MGNSSPVSETSSTSGSIGRVMSQDSLPGKGRILLDMFDKARNDQKIKSLGDGEIETVKFCQDVLRVGAPDLSARFLVQQTISCGTTSVVCLALDLSTGLNHQQVAIKYCRLGKDPTSREFKERQRQFETEAKYQTRCACPQVVALLEFRIVDVFAVFVMEYLPRTLLDDIVESNRSLSGASFPELRAARHVRTVALALETCHRMKVAHLDVKLDNILVSETGEAKLCDFGLAEIVPVVRSVATPLYSPPEIITEGKCCEKADMWSLGVCVFILLCGYPPFQPDERASLEHNITHARYSFKSEEGWNHVSSLARDLVAQLLVIDPMQRFSATQVLHHPWIVACEKREENRFAKMSGPPPLQRMASTIVLEELHEETTKEHLAKRERNTTSFLEFAQDIRMGWGGSKNEEEEGQRQEADKNFMRDMYGCTSPLTPPKWVPDWEADSCRLCDEPFTFCHRRHHCRACGQLICQACSSRKRVVFRVNSKTPVRVCDLCAISSRETMPMGGSLKLREMS